MMLFIDLAESWVGDVRVDLCCLDRGVAEHRLDTPNICAIHQEIGRVRVAERMWSNTFRYPGFFSVMIDEALNRAGSEVEVPGGAFTCPISS